MAWVKVGLAPGCAGFEKEWLIEEWGTSVLYPVGGICFIERAVILRMDQWSAT